MSGSGTELGLNSDNGEGDGYGLGFDEEDLASEKLGEKMRFIRG